jgi:hypothetical protein
MAPLAKGPVTALMCHFRFRIGHDGRFLKLNNAGEYLPCRRAGLAAINGILRLDMQVQRGAGWQGPDFTDTKTNWNIAGSGARSEGSDSGRS